MSYVFNSQIIPGKRSRIEIPGDYERFLLQQLLDITWVSDIIGARRKQIKVGTVKDFK